nr:Pls/PosA family non-ribosomal peptide synthetase [Kineosphaera limosa]
MLRSGAAAPPRTLVDIFEEICTEYPDSVALDNGAEQLSYSEFREAAAELGDRLAAAGVGPGARVGVRIASGTTDLYVAIMGILLAGAAYVPVDRDDPKERARLVFGEAGVAAIVGSDLTIEAGPGATPATATDPAEALRPVEPEDDAWIIFTSGSTGTPKGVAVTHRNAAAFVDAESRMFLQRKPIGPQDRVMAGLSVGFDASCEEMWLAWAHGAALVPAPRSLVRSGMDLGPWLVANRVTIVSTVPTLVAMWPDDALADVRLLIVGGEACPPELGARYATPEREVWNTYGPTEATVVACGAQVDGSLPVRIGLPLDGWDLAVVDDQGQPVPDGQEGELVIGGVGLARYLDPAKDAEKYAPMPSLGWERAYRSGDLVVFDGEGLVFHGRADDQVKVGGRRIELGELDARLLDLPGVLGGAAAVRQTASGTKILVGYLKVDDSYDQDGALERLRADLPAALVPRLAVVDDLPTRTSGKIDRDALPWPLAQTSDDDADVDLSDLTDTQAWLAGAWRDVLGASVRSADDDFFDLGGSSLSAAHLVSALRARFPGVRVAHIYDNPSLRALAAELDGQEAPATTDDDREIDPVRRRAGAWQCAGLLLARALTGLRWLTWIMLGLWLADATLGLGAAAALGLPAWSDPRFWAPVALGWALLLTPPGRMLVAAALARLILLGVTPGTYPRGGSVHLRVWFAERITDEIGPTGLGGAALNRWYARMLGATVGRHVDLHSVPPVTGFLTLGNGASVETEVDLAGHWLDGDEFVLGRVAVGRRARVGMRSTLLPGADIGTDAEIAPGAAVFGPVPEGEYWSGAPATRFGPARGPWADAKPVNKPVWLLAYTAGGQLLALLPALCITLAALIVEGLGRLLGVATPATASSVSGAVGAALAWSPLAALVAFALLTGAVLGLVRVLAVGLVPGHYPVQGRLAWQAWMTIRLLDEARTWLFPLYSGALTARWWRLLGAKVGKDVESSTALMIPHLVTIGDAAFLADDTLIGGYELGGGWLRIERVKIGKRAFIGNSGMAAPGRKVPKGALVAVLSAAPRRGRAKRGTSWLGSPPAPVRRAVTENQDERTYEPTQGLRVARAFVETCRLTSLMAQGLWFAAAAGVIVLIGTSWVWPAAALLAGPVLALGALAAGALAVAVKWLLVGRIRRTDHPLWTSFVWRNELADTFVEQLAAPWLLRAATGTPILTAWFRAMGARIGSGVWCETYWLPEADLVALGDGATVGRGCVVQTHLFHDRVLSMDSVTLHAGATLGPNSVILPAADIGRNSTVGPVSLVMRGESVPERTRWIGNPIGPWQ